MSGTIDERNRRLEQLDELVAQLIAFYADLPNPDAMVYERWTAKDVLAHLTFWHESFARNVCDLANDVKPTPLKGKLGDLNQAGVDEMKPCTLETVIQRFQTAHQIIRENILNPKMGLIPYRKGTRDYTPEEHLEIVVDHITKHLRDVRKICG